MITISTASKSSIVTMIEWLRCSTPIHKVLCSNLSILMHEMTWNKSITPKLSQMTHSFRASVSMLDRRDADIAVRKKTIETGCMWILIITSAGDKPMGGYYYY